jgi:hypothetical protein
MQQELTVFDMLAMPFYHPVLEVGLRRTERCTPFSTTVL